MNKLVINRLIIVGNGFDRAHNLQTSYENFIDWYWKKRIYSFVGNETRESKDELCTITINENLNINNWKSFYYKYCRHIKGYNEPTINSGDALLKYIKEYPLLFTYQASPFFALIMNSITTKKWTDIEENYYQVLKKIRKVNEKEIIQELNNQLKYIQESLIEYLETIQNPAQIKDLFTAMTEPFDTNDFSIISTKKATGYTPEQIEKYQLLEPLIFHITVLNFNYTNTINNYISNNINIINIHGNITNPNSIIFGYGDELDNVFQEILNQNNNELLKNMKSVRYLQSEHYRKLLQFIQSGPYQVMIIGHSCGISDRTLLNTVFEHENCISIKPFYHIDEKQSDNYFEIVMNIYRNFKNKQLYRDRVVNKKQCLTI